MLNASNNDISTLSTDIQSLFGLETLILYGNPVVNAHPILAKIEGNSMQV